MNPNLLLEQYSDQDLSQHFSNYTVSDLQSNLLKLIQTNIIYSHCESLIIDNQDCTEEEIARILDCCKDKSHNSLCTRLPFKLLTKLKNHKDEIQANNWSRQEIVDIILNLVIENTLLYSTLAKFAYE